MCWTTVMLTSNKHIWLWFGGVSFGQHPWGLIIYLHNLKLTHWSRMTHICIGKLTTIGSDNGLSPGRRQAIIWTNAGILLIGPIGTNLGEILIGIQTFSLKKICLKMSSVKCQPFCLSLNVLIGGPLVLEDGIDWVMWWSDLVEISRTWPHLGKFQEF